MGCFSEDLDLAAIWWPLTSTLISKTLSVSTAHMGILITVHGLSFLKVNLGVSKLYHVRDPNPEHSLMLHDSRKYLAPEITEKRTIVCRLSN